MVKNSRYRTAPLYGAPGLPAPVGRVDYSLSQHTEDVDPCEDDGGADESLSAVALPEQCYAEEGAEYDAHLPQGKDVADRGQSHRVEDEDVADPHDEA